MAQVGPSSDPATAAPVYPCPPPTVVLPPVNPAVGAAGAVASPGQTAQYHKTSVLIVCQFCQATVTTSLTYAVGIYTYVFVLVFILIGLWMGCCLIPFFIDSCKDVVHSCPNCHQTVGRYYNHM